MHFIDQINFITPLHRFILHIIQQFASIFDFGTGGGIDFKQINKTPFFNRAAVFTFAARLCCDAVFAVQTFSKQTSYRGFADTASAGKQVGVVQSVIFQSIGKCGQHMLLTNHFRKPLRSPFSGEYLIAHDES